MKFQNIIKIEKIYLVLLSILICFFLIIPQAFAKHSITIDDLSSIRDIKSKTLSPDGKYIAFQTIQAHKDTNNFIVGWYIAAIKQNAKPIKIAESAQAQPNGNGGFDGSDIIWSPDSKWIYFTKKHEGAVQIWRSSREHPEQQQITNNAGDIQSLDISRDGSKVIFNIGRTRSEITALKRKLSEQGFLHQQPILYSLRFDANIAQCTDGRKRYSEVTEIHSCQLSYWIFETDSGVEREATEVEISRRLVRADTTRERRNKGWLVGEERQMQRFSADGAQLAWIENKDSEVYKGLFPQMILKVSRDGKEVICPATECISQRKVGFRGIWWHPNGREIIFHVIDGPHNSLNSFYAWVPGEVSVRLILRTDDYFGIGYYGHPCDLAGEKLVCARSTSTSPTEIASIHLGSGKISTIVDVNPEFNDLRFTKVEKILGEDNYGHNVYAHLVYPEGYIKGQRYPLVISSYNSYGFLRGNEEQPIHAYAQNGIAVLSFDYGGRHTDYVKKINIKRYSKAFNHDVFVNQGSVTAIEKMVENLIDRGIVDSRKIGISGISHGSVILTNSILRQNYAAASTAEIFSIPTYFKKSSSSARGKSYDETFGKITSSEGQAMRRKFSLAANAQSIDTPILSQVSDQEFRFSEVDYNALLDAGKPIEMYVYPDERHIKWQPAHKYMVYRRNVDWFNFWLQGVEDDDPEKVEQYTRWRKMRADFCTSLEGAAPSPRFNGEVGPWYCEK